MIESLLQVPNVCWQDGALGAIDDFPVASARGLATVSGRFAVAHEVDSGIVLARDKLGLNKLFVAYDPTRGLVVANYLTDLIGAGFPFRAISAVPAGATVHVDLNRKTTTTERFYQLPHTAGTDLDPAVVTERARQDLVRTFELIARDFAGAAIVVCLSGGLDSALIAAMTSRYLSDVTAYTYSYSAKGMSVSQDANAAERTAHALGLNFRLVTADEDAVLKAIPRALRYGQDWRDFNVHCAIVNELLAEAIASDMTRNGDGRPVIVLTGDLMNEIVADYSPVVYGGRDYYALPDLPPERLRSVLLSGIQTGDREVGVFSRRGLTVVQPYAHIFEHLLLLRNSVDKGYVINSLAGELLPSETYQRTKIRAQIGDLKAHDGILPLFIDSGRDSHWLQTAFCREIGVAHPDELRAATRAGTYRPPSPNLWSTHAD